MRESFHRRRIFFLLFAAAIIICLTAHSLLAVCAEPHPRVCTEYYDSDAVFTGTVVEVRSDPPGESSPNGWFYRVRVEKSFRGPSRQFIDVYTENASARFPLEKNRKYLLFAGSIKGVLNIDCCGNSSFLEESAEAIRQIERIKETKSGGEIAGRMDWGESPEFKGTRILAVGKDRTYETRIDSNGWFHMKVPEGVYRVRAEAPRGGGYGAFDLSYDNPDHIVVKPGGCPQVQFMSHRLN